MVGPGGGPRRLRGTVLVAGHVDTQRSGRPSARRPRGTDRRRGRAYAYLNTARRTYEQEAPPADLFNRAGAPRLALITCAGRYDQAADRYLKNLILYAKPTS
ncbi:hypothetical protein AR457_37085 [Streptomyces agglomeratus]|nr:hypothetical protein AR457_37085 [Streptomyces agglomeratus]